MAADALAVPLQARSCPAQTWQGCFAGRAEPISGERRRIRTRHAAAAVYATIALDAGIDAKILIDRMGHANMASLAIYTHRSTGRDRQAAVTVADLIFPDEDATS